MALQCGIVGLPNVGKSTLFNALTKAGVPAENYPFNTIDPHLGLVELPDIRLLNLSKIYNPKKITPSFVEFIDIAGLVKGAHKGEGLGNQFLGQIRQTSVIIHVVRCFDDKSITHVNGGTNPIRDMEIINTELLLADIDMLEKRKTKMIKTVKSKDKDALKLLKLIEYLSDKISNGLPANAIKVEDGLYPLKNALQLLTDKPVLYIANISENDILNKDQNAHLSSLEKYLNHNTVIPLCGTLEQEIAALDNNEKTLFLKEYNLFEPGLNKVIRLSFELLKLQNFFTCGEKEVRSWIVKNDATAPEAAGKIHSDFQKGFIKADVFQYNDIIEHKSEKILRELGLIRQEGREYTVKDGDCIFFKFNV